MGAIRQGLPVAGRQVLPIAARHDVTARARAIPVIVLNGFLIFPAQSARVINTLASFLRAMKISDSGPIRSQRLRRVGRGSSDKATDFAHHLSAGDDEQASPASALTGTASISGVDSLLSLQEVPDAATGRSRGLKRAGDLLDQLDEIRYGLLMGGLSRANLQDLARSVRQQRATVTDPRLTEILDEIELRAAVELAKYGLTA